MSNLFTANPYYKQSRAYFAQMGYESVTILVPQVATEKVVTSIPVTSTEFKVITVKTAANMFYLIYFRRFWQGQMRQRGRVNHPMIMTCLHFP